MKVDKESLWSTITQRGVSIKMKDDKVKPVVVSQAECGQALMVHSEALKDIAEEIHLLTSRIDRLYYTLIVTIGISILVSLIGALWR